MLISACLSKTEKDISVIKYKKMAAIRSLGCNKNYSRLFIMFDNPLMVGEKAVNGAVFYLIGI